MKKTLLMMSLGALLYGGQSYGLTAETQTTSRSVTIKTDGTYNEGGSITYGNGVLTGADLTGITFDYDYSEVNTAAYLIYTGVNSGADVAYGLFTTTNGGVTGAWKSDTEAAIHAYTNGGTVDVSVFSGKDQLIEGAEGEEPTKSGKIKLTVALDNGKGVAFAAGESVTLPNAAGENINGNNATASTTGDLYRCFGLKSSSTKNQTVTINTEYISALYVTDIFSDTTYTSNGHTVVKQSGTYINATTKRLDVKGGDGGNATEISGSANPIYVGGSGQLFLQTHGEDSGSITLDNVIYLASSTHADVSSYGVLRFGSDGANRTTTLNGKIVVLEDTSMVTASSNPVYIKGAVTDKEYIDGAVSEGGKTLTVKGSGIEFSGSVDVSGLVINDGATFSDKVDVDNMTAKGGVSFGGETNIGTLNLAFGLSSTSAAVTTSGALTLGNISLNLTGYNTGIYTLVNATGDGSITWNANAENAWSKTGLGEGLMASVGYVGENSETLQLSIANAITTTSVTGYSLNEAGTALTLNVEEAVLMEGMVVNVNLLTDDLMQAILADMKAIEGAISEDGKAMVSITLAGSVSGTITADTLNEVVFVKGDTGQSYWGEMVGGQLMYNVERIPEPTTATLSLLALMGLAARRRRQK